MATQQYEEDHSRAEARKFMKAIFGDLPKDQIIHHIDGDPLNNTLNNLAVIENKDHLKFHKKAQQILKLIKDAGFTQGEALIFLGYKKPPAKKFQTKPVYRLLSPDGRYFVDFDNLDEAKIIRSRHSGPIKIIKNNRLISFC